MGRNGCSWEVHTRKGITRSLAHRVSPENFGDSFGSLGVHQRKGDQRILEQLMSRKCYEPTAEVEWSRWRSGARKFSQQHARDKAVCDFFFHSSNLGAHPAIRVFFVVVHKHGLVYRRHVQWQNFMASHWTSTSPINPSQRQNWAFPSPIHLMPPFNLLKCV